MKGVEEGAGEDFVGDELFGVSSSVGMGEEGGVDGGDLRFGGEAFMNSFEGVESLEEIPWKTKEAR